jgi:hypothetical protein
VSGFGGLGCNLNPEDLQVILDEDVKSSASLQVGSELADKAVTATFNCAKRRSLPRSKRSSSELQE